jgi:hypothetical protein
MDMIESRNRTVHTYDINLLQQEFTKVHDIYLLCFEQLAQTMSLKL